MENNGSVTITGMRQPGKTSRAQLCTCNICVLHPWRRQARSEGIADAPWEPTPPRKPKPDHKEEEPMFSLFEMDGCIREIGPDEHRYSAEEIYSLFEMDK